MCFWAVALDVGLPIGAVALLAWSVGHEAVARFYDLRIAAHTRRLHRLAEAEGAAASALKTKIAAAQQLKEAYRGPLKAGPMILFVLAVAVLGARIVGILDLEAAVCAAEPVAVSALGLRDCEICALWPIETKI